MARPAWCRYLWAASPDLVPIVRNGRGFLGQQSGHSSATMMAGAPPTAARDTILHASPRRSACARHNALAGTGVVHASTTLGIRLLSGRLSSGIASGSTLS